MDLYAENILEHYRHPHAKRPITNPSVTHEELNASCGDRLSVSLAINDDRIESIGWAGEGCAISQAAMSMLSDRLLGMHVNDVALIQKKDINDMLGVPISTRRIKCALLALHALHNAMHRYHGQKEQSWVATLEEYIATEKTD